ncbi:MAG: S-layer homology domain-containing protein [Ruminococcaceae bacterium]|nr:S-layer homology domain-containing protein [Oscillospiraceae bacterium]
MRKILSVALSVIMLASFLAIGASALTLDENLSLNWNAMASKYSSRTKNPIYYSDNGIRYLKSEGFEYKVNSDNGIDMIVPDYDTFNGVNGTSVLTSNHKTLLNGLSIDISLDDFVFTNDPHYISNNIGILWTEDPICDLESITTGDYTRLYGLSHLISVNKNSEDFKHGVPVRDANESAVTGKALYINLNNSFGVNNSDSKIANTLTIVYFDGHFINEKDGFPGYAWKFTVNNPADPYDDYPNIVGNFNGIDLSYGLFINIKSDEELGYIVNINGTDYYKGTDISFFPSADINGYAHPEITEQDRFDLTSVYTSSMTYAKKDIDLSGLTEAKSGYLSIGVTGTDDSKHDIPANITIDKINNLPAAKWKGESSCKHPEMVWMITKEANCGEDGVEAYVCTACGFFTETNLIPATNNHSYPDEWSVIKEANCTEKGEKSKQCSVCDNVITEEIAIDEAAHAKQTKTVKEPSCTETGLIETYCTLCGDAFENEAQIIPVKDHTPGEWVITESTYTENGSKVRYCTECDTELEKEIIPKLYFDDVYADDWYYEAVCYCSEKGYVIGVGENKFKPDAKLTREQFVTILARVANADLTKHTTTKFTDVNTESWYAPYIMWAENEGCVLGIGNSKFGVGEPLTRESLAVIFFRYAEKIGLDTSVRADLSSYIDEDEISEWAYESCSWAVGIKLLGSASVEFNSFVPKLCLTRSQATQIFMNYDEKVK